MGGSAMADASLIAEIRCNGQIYNSWKSVMVRRDYTDPFSYAQFIAAEPASAGSSWGDMKLKPGDSCEIYLAGVKVISGQVITRTVVYDDRNHDLIIIVKSFTLMTLSSVKVRPGTFDGYTFEQAAKGVLADVGVNLVINNPTDVISLPFKKLMPQYGQSIIEFIYSMSIFREVFLSDDADGNLVASNADPNQSAVAQLEEGVNILRLYGTLTNDLAFQTIGTSGQVSGDDQYWATQARDIAAQTTNANGQPNTYYLHEAERPGLPREIQARNTHEFVKSLWPQVDVTVTVAGWLQPDGNLWKETKNVSIKSPMMFPTEDGSFTLGIQTVVYEQSSETGTTTTLTLRLPQAMYHLPAAGQADPAAGDVLSNPRPDGSGSQVLPPDINPVS